MATTAEPTAGVGDDLDHEAEETDAEPKPLTPAEMAEYDQGDTG